MNALTESIIKAHGLWLESGGRVGVRADLRNADLRNADLRNADLRNADLRNADLRNADLRNADLRGVNFDYVAWPLWCGAFAVRADDRLVAQLACHLTRLNVSECSPAVREAVEKIRMMPLADLFCDYRFDVKRINERKE